LKVGGVLTLPKYLENWQDFAACLLIGTILLMLAFEPIVWCIAEDFSDGFLLLECSAAEDIMDFYAFFCMLTMFLYYALLVDLTVLSTKVSAYVLVCIRMISEVGLLILSLVTTILTFSTAIGALKHDQELFPSVQTGIVSLFTISMGTMSGEDYDDFKDDPALLVVISWFAILVVVFLLNLLIAQLTCAYEAVYKDMVGYALMERIDIINATMPAVTEVAWNRFVASLKLDEELEFGKGDIGLPGGIQIFEPGGAHMVTEDMIQRFGGSTDNSSPWPEDASANDEGRFKRLEKALQKLLKRMSSEGGGSSRGHHTSSSQMTGSQQDTTSASVVSMMNSE